MCSSRGMGPGLSLLCSFLLTPKRAEDGTMGSFHPPRAGKGAGYSRRGHFNFYEAYHTATATIFMTDSLRHWQKLTRGAPLSPMRPSMMPVEAGTHESITDGTDRGEGMCDACTCRHLLVARQGQTACTHRPQPRLNSQQLLMH